MMDNYCAPQWADFTRSPQLPSDSYFEIEHAVHEPSLPFKTYVHSDFSLESVEERAEGSPVVKPRFKDSLEPLENPQPNVAYFIPHSNRKAPPRETNDDRGLRRTMANLRLDEQSRKAQYTWNVSPSGRTSTTLFRAKVEVPERFRKSARTSESKSSVVGKSVRNNRATRGAKEETNAQGASTKNTSKSMVNSELGSCSEYAETDAPRKRPSHGSRRRQSELFRRSSTGKAPKVLTCQYRRRSLLKYRRCSNKFVSMAEAVLKFQNAVPQRFRTVSRNEMKPGPLMKLKRRSPLKLTQPISPALRCKQRSRQTTILSQEEREALELEEMKKHQIKAKPVPVDILKAPCKLKEVAKKPITITEEFRFARPKKTPHAVDDKECNSKTAAPTARLARSSNISQNENCTEQATESSAKSVKNCLPSSFEARNKLFQKKREENLKNQQLQEAKKLATEFHAKPAPNFLKPRKPGKEQNVRRSVVACPFSFAERDKGLAKKKEEHIKELQEQDKKAHVFHANPAPPFKPVTIQGSSKGNLRSKEKLPTSPRHLATRETRSFNDQENKQPNSIPNPTICPTAKKETVKKQCKTSRRTNA
ncbi:uncharacterized protein LOC143376863 [Andrena cerasifolii]|uniref:uncharacterized protein LOC143376863 n=1 Tax=Andrena cerasifolii TaxID=2819439 RepID=UPI0040379377